MQSESIEQLLARKRAEKGETPPSAVQSLFYSQQPVEWPLPLWLEIRFRNGTVISLDAKDFSWISYDPDGSFLDLHIEGFGVTIKGNGLYPHLYEALRTKRVAWLKEADSDMQGQNGKEVYIEYIAITPPE